METKKYIFLDIDGVLNSDIFYAARYARRNGLAVGSDRLYPEGRADQFYEGSIDKSAVDLLNGLVDATGSEIVLSSSWRHSPASVEEFRKLGIPISDITPTVCEGIRGEEIQMFLDNHPCKSYCILDDDCDMLDSQMENLVHVDFRFGLTEEDCRKALEILGPR